MNINPYGIRNSLMHAWAIGLCCVLHVILCSVTHTHNYITWLRYDTRKDCEGRRYREVEARFIIRNSRSERHKVQFQEGYCLWGLWLVFYSLEAARIKPHSCILSILNGECVYNRSRRKGIYNGDLDLVVLGELGGVLAWRQALPLLYRTHD